MRCTANIKPVPCNGGCCGGATTHLLIALGIAESYPLHSLSRVSWRTGLTAETWSSVHTSHTREARVVTTLQRKNEPSACSCFSNIQTLAVSTDLSPKAMLHSTSVGPLFREGLERKSSLQMVKTSVSLQLSL